MTCEELKTKHFIIPDQAFCSAILHSKISIQFAIDCLKELLVPGGVYNNVIVMKIEQLKKLK